MTHDEMDALTGDTDNKSEKIRRLFEAGVSAAEISAYLGIRYQHTYNVLKRAGHVGKNTAATPASNAETSAFVIPLEAGGVIRLPEHVLAAQGYAAGDKLVCRSGDDGLTIMSRDRAIDYLREVVRARAADDLSLLDALLGSRPSIGSDPPS
jgi:hypothetical protein